MKKSDPEALIDHIYEAAVVPQRWSDVLDGMAQIAGGLGTMLFAATPSAPNMQLISSPAIRDFTDYWLTSRWVEFNGRGQRLIPIREPRFLTDLDGFTAEELDREPFYTEFLRPRGLGWCAGTAIRSPAGDTLVFSIEREQFKGPVEPDQVRALDALRPHLARSALLAARVGLERARATVEMLQAIGFPAAVLTNSGRVVAINEAIGDCAPTLRIGAQDKVVFANSACAEAFEGALAMLGDRSIEGRSLPLAAHSERPPMIVHLLPFRRSALDLFSGAFAVMYVTPVVQQAAPHPALLEALFDLTAAEARVASQLVEGRSVAEIAQRQGVSDSTIRAHLKSIFPKTGTHRQAELVSLLTVNASPGG